jgi:hypothetical protein
MTSTKLIALMNVYFSGVLFASFDGSGKFPDIESYFREMEDGWVLDMRNMSGQKRFAGLFPESKETERMTEAAWEALSRKVRDERSKGGLVRPFIDEDDDRFLEGFNDGTLSVDIVRSETFSIPAEFCEALNTLQAFAMYSPKADTFVWDFSALIRRYKPDTPYSAYRRYAHGQYTRLFIGATMAPGEKRPARLREAGNTALLKEVGSGTDWELVEDALQDGSEKNIYASGSLEIVLINVKSHKNRRYKMGLKEGEKPVFDHVDAENIKNAVNAILPLLSAEVRTGLEKDGLFVKVRKLYQAIADPDVSEKLDKRRLDTIRALYRKIWIFRPVELDAPVVGNNGTEDEETYGGRVEADAHETPEQVILLMEDRESLIGLFEGQFAGSDAFLDKIRLWVREDSLSHIDDELARYQGKGHNTGSTLFTIFCEANGYDPNDPAVRKSHTAFAVKIRIIIDGFGKEEV